MIRIQQGIGHLPSLELKPDNEGKLGPAAILAMANRVKALIALLNGKIRFGSGLPNTAGGNFDTIFLRLEFKAADTEIVLPHDLGRPPVIAWPTFWDRSCNIYSMRGAANAWGDETKAYFACDTADANVVVFLA